MPSHETSIREVAVSRAWNLFALLLLLLPPGLSAEPYPLAPDDLCGNSQTCVEVLSRWNEASWVDLVDDGFHLGPESLAAVRWYTTEGACTGVLCNDQLQDGGGSCSTLDAANSQFCGVTYGIACAKQTAGTWAGGLDYCADYLQQGNAICRPAAPGFESAPRSA